MKNSQYLIKKLTHDVNKVQNKINHRNIYNIRNFAVRLLLNGGIVLDYSLPFVIGAVIAINTQAYKKNPPFQKDSIATKIKVETVDTSSGIHYESVSNDFNYNKSSIEYSTGWTINDDGLYERTATSYRLSDDIDLSNTEQILSMTKEELEQLLTITNVKTIKTNTITPDDSIYASDAIIITKHSDSAEKAYRSETNIENFFNSLAYFSLIFCIGSSLRKVKNIFLRSYVQDKLNGYKSEFRQINKEELETLRNSLKLKQENLAMINNPYPNSEDQNGLSYRLIKNKRR